MDEVVEWVRSGKCIVYPTSTLPALGCIPETNALDALFEIKGRPRSAPVSLGVADLSQASEIVEVTDDVYEILEFFPKGSLTIVLNPKDEMDFRLEVVNLGSDQDGDLITSCVAVSDLFRPPPKPVLRGSNQRAVWEDLISRYSIGDVVPTSLVRQHAKETLGGTDRPVARALEVIDKLLEKGYLKEADKGYEFL